MNALQKNGQSKKGELIKTFKRMSSDQFMVSELLNICSKVSLNGAIECLALCVRGTNTALPSSVPLSPLNCSWFALRGTKCSVVVTTKKNRNNS